FYLPYLGIVSGRGVEEPTKVDRYGYQSLAILAFEPDELQGIVEGARRVEQAGDPVLAAEARHAVRKLAFDLPLGATDGPGEPTLAAPRNRADPKALTVLGDALFRRKRVTVSYHTMGTGASSQRTVEPYGLFFVNGHWYLAARDVDKDALRNFRVSRIEEVTLNAAKAGTSDYEIPAGFTLREHAQSRQAWEIGDGDTIEAIVNFTGGTGAVLAASALGTPVDGAPTQRRFTVRRADSFARWLFSFAGDVVPVGPETLVHEYTRLLASTRALYEDRADG
ncbi:MAG: WYL domain-containing protein, partial [bacterium]